MTIHLPSLRRLAGAALLLAPTILLAAESPWPQFGGDRGHTGRSSAPGLLAARVRWQTPATGPVSGSPVIDGAGRIFVGGSNGTVAAVDRQGSLLWAVPVGGAVWGTPLVGAGGELLVATAAGQLVAIDAASGAILRRTALGGAVAESSPSEGPDGTLYVGTVEGDLVAVAPDGSIRWRNGFGSGLHGSPAVREDGTVLAGDGVGRFRGVSAAGATLFEVRFGDAVGSSSPLLVPEGSITGCRDGRLYAVGPAGGMLWSAPISPTPLAGSPAAGSSGSVLVGSNSGWIHAVDAKSGRILWKQPVGSALTGPLATSAEGIVYAGTDGGRLLGIAPGGATLWKLEIGASIAGGVAVDSDGTIYVGDALGRLTAVASESELFIPAVARADGLEGTKWKSDLSLLDPGGQPLDVSISLLERDRDNSSPDQRSVTVPPAGVANVADVVGILFGRESASGALRISSPTGAVVTSRTYNDAPAGTFGQGIPAFSRGEALAAGDSGELVGVSESGSFRTNLGLLNLSLATVTAEATFRDAAGNVLGTKSFELAARSQTQLSRAFSAVTTGSIAGGRISIRVVAGGDSPLPTLLAYASVVDNRSGDPVFLPAVRSPR
jgi:outer membrane protein assembly factor BamB